MRKAGTSLGRILANLLVAARAIVTAGFAKRWACVRCRPEAAPVATVLARSAIATLPPERPLHDARTDDRGEQHGGAHGFRDEPPSA